MNEVVLFKNGSDENEAKKIIEAFKDAGLEIAEIDIQGDEDAQATLKNVCDFKTPVILSNLIETFQGYDANKVSTLIARVKQVRERNYV
ncbi:hypothetical protein ESZ50_02180 [Weissella muntiaci]|uniref:Uncharacterized protein n=1 Tax=Weissella muntiaci TaxID=2508881 RepID=A0A6C2CBR2_9LACO|nr:hypothetical protein [Weissella muntiaci]TYC50495.1 hypothetical protein ESZ50_02180 [Weissella muntiaci]